MMNLREKALFHQIHPAKLLVDWGTALASCWLFWRHYVALGIVVGFIPSLAASALMLRYGDFTEEAASRAGVSLRAHMTPAMQALRLVGVFVLWTGAWRHSIGSMVAGLLVIVAGWARTLAMR